MRRKPILCLDFDGVLHSYKSGWKGIDVIPDPPVPGAVDFCRRAAEHFDIHILSSRSATAEGREAMWVWLRVNGFNMDLELTATKPAAYVSLDDRCLPFNGTFPSIQELANFRSWVEEP